MEERDEAITSVYGGKKGSVRHVKTRELLYVALGGALGTLARLNIDLALSGVVLGEHLATLAVNLLGALLLGLATGHGLPRLSSPVRSGITVGLLGSFTTFSAISILAIGGPLPLSLAYVASTFVLGVAAAWAGWRLGTPTPPRVGVAL
jgi:CrcB protein